ncbi:MAG TPA: ferredoxin oxidoreductase, partial [Nitrospiria bacterium]|nr:ferredoxin oxidoreductase [Nitrospiria bacterium]
MFLKAPREKVFITGSEAAKEAIRRANVDIAISYPITPQSETMQQVGYLYAEGYLKDYYRGEEEYGVMSAIAGSSRAGVRCLSATAGPGLMRGIEVITSWPGGRLPAVLLVMCRVINAPLAIQPDNVELSYLLNCGILLFHAENQQDFYDFALSAFPITEKCEVTLPAAVAVDGFFVTHARGWVEMPSADLKLPPRDCYHEAVPMMDNENPPIRISRDAPIQKSNFISYQMHASWQQEIFAAVERSRKWIERWMGGLIEVVNPGAK